MHSEEPVAIQAAQELEKFLIAVPRHAHADHLPFQHIESCE